MYKTLDDQIVELSRRLAAIDKNAKELRTEVSTLEIARHAQEMYRTTETDDVSVIAIPKEDRAVTIGRHYPENRLVKRPALQGFYDELNAKISEASVALRTYCDARNEQSTRAAKLDLMEKNAQALQAHLTWMQQQQASSKPTSTLSTRPCPISANNEVHQLKVRLADIVAKQKTLQLITEQQGKVLGELRDKIDANSGLDEELTALKTDVALIESESRSVQDEIDATRRLLKRKDKLHGVSVKRSVVPEMRDLEAEKRVTRSKLHGHQEQVRINEAAIRHRAITIVRLQGRLESIGEVLQGATPTNEEGEPVYERVDATTVESLRREAEILSKTSLDNNDRIESLDADLEQLMNRKRILLDAQRMVGELEAQRRKEHDRYTRLVEKQRIQQQRDAGMFMERLHDEVSSMREESSQRRSRSSQNEVERSPPAATDPHSPNVESTTVVAAVINGPHAGSEEDTIATTSTTAPEREVIDVVPEASTTSSQMHDEHVNITNGDVEPSSPKIVTPSEDAPIATTEPEIEMHRNVEDF